MLYRPSDDPTSSTSSSAMVTSVGALSFHFTWPRVLLSFTCTFVWTLGSGLDSRITSSEEASLRRLHEGRSERIWHATLMFIACLTVTGMLGVALLAWTICRHCCCERALRIEVAENFEVEENVAIEGRDAERAAQFQGIVIGAASVDQEDTLAGSGRTDGTQEQQTGEDSASEQKSLAYTRSSTPAAVSDEVLSSTSCFGI